MEFICFFLTNEVEHLFILIGHLKYSDMIESFAHFSVGSFVFFLLIISIFKNIFW